MAEWKHFQLRNIDADTLGRLITDSVADERSLSDYIRVILCDYYDLDCLPPQKAQAKSKLEHGARTQQLRLQPALYEAIIKDAYEQERSRRSVILEILEAHYLEVSAS